MGVRGPKDYNKESYDFFINNIYPRRIASRVKIKKIYSEESKNYPSDFEKTAEVRFVEYHSPVTFLVIDELTIIGIHSVHPISITIKSKEVAKSFIEQFELMWKIAKP